MADRQFFGRGDLHVIDVVAVPDRLENGVGEPQHEDVLHRLLAEVMVDAVDLVLGEHPVDLFVQLVARGQVGAEGLFDHEPPRGRGLRGPGPPRQAGRLPARTSCGAIER